jgi:hypothetical protein
MAHAREPAVHASSDTAINSWIKASTGDTSMIVVITGMPRSGSTLSFNIAREILGKKGRVHQEASNSLTPALDATKGTGVDHVLIKTHDADEDLMRRIDDGSAKSICTIRTVEDAAASLMNTFDFNSDHVIQMMMAWLRMYERIRHKSLVLDYDDIERRPISVARRIARYVDPECPVRHILWAAYSFRRSRVASRFEQLQPDSPNVENIGFSYYDKDTFFHRRHVSRRAGPGIEDRLDAGELARLRLVLGTAVSGISDPLLTMRR